jgi:hypothetical protein
MEAYEEPKQEGEKQEQEPQGPVGKNKQDPFDPCSGKFLFFTY